MKIQFLGGASTVTGSKTLIETGNTRILVDCGQFQGIKPLRELNWQPLPINPKTIQAVLLTHGHLDHCGWLPRLVSEGFSGPIYCTAPTREITKLILRDSAKIQEEEASKANNENYSKHSPAEALYTIAQAEKVFQMLRIIDVDIPFSLGQGISALFRNAGHIIGACSIELTVENKLLVFSGDIGRNDDVLMYPPNKPKKADYLFLESTYGNRQHPDYDIKAELEMHINNTLRHAGTVIIPGFAVERAQSVMYLIWQLHKEGRIPDVPYILDTPMGISVLDIFRNHPDWHKLSSEDCAEMCRLFTMVSDYHETLENIENNEPKVVIAASGMITGGRVLSYLEYYIGKPETTVLIVGYQAEGTRGRKLLEGAQQVKIHGRLFTVRAKIIEIQGMSAHADQNGLVDWLSELSNNPQNIFLVHGENQPADELRIKINEKYGYACKVPLLNETVTL